jgi:tartrate-resistant acid phosphatase type 5
MTIPSSTPNSLKFAILLIALSSCTEKSPLTTAIAPRKSAEVSQARTPARHESSKEPKICALGDSGDGGDTQRRVAQAMTRFGCTDILLLGDNFYPAGVTSLDDPQWQTAFRIPYRALLEAGATFYPVLGNHDYAQNRGRVDYTQFQVQYHSQRLPQWHMPAKTYSFQLGENFCAIATDTNQLNTQQADWIRTQVRAAPCSWKVAFGHHPIVSSGHHGSTGGRVESFLRPALEGVHLFLCGHEHSFQDEGNIPVNPSRGDGPRFRHLVIGTGGAHHYPVREHQTPDLRYAESTYGFLHLEPSPTRMKFTFYNANLEARYSNCIEKAGDSFVDASCTPTGS